MALVMAAALLVAADRAPASGPTTGPYIVLFGNSATDDDRAKVIRNFSQQYFDWPEAKLAFFLCSTPSSPRQATSNISAVWEGLVKNGVPAGLIYDGGRCLDLDLPTNREIPQNAVWVILDGQWHLPRRMACRAKRQRYC